MLLTGTKVKLSTSVALLCFVVICTLVGIPGMMDDVADWQKWIAEWSEAIPWELAMLSAGVSLLGAVAPWLPWMPWNRSEESPPTNTDPLSDEERVYRQISKEKARQLEKRRKKLEETSEELAGLRKRHEALRKQHGEMWIQLCSKAPEPLGLSVAVQFVDINDLNLAKQADALFPATFWKKKEIKQISYTQNISDCRIVIFGNHKHIGGLRAAINDCGLLGEQVASLPPMDPSMREDVRIVIFPRERDD